MGRYDFDFGHNVAPPAANAAVPVYECMGRVVCAICGKFHGYCSEVGSQLAGINRDPLYTTPGVPYKQWEGNMDLSKQVSGKKREAFEKRDWIASEDLPAKGSSKWKVDGARDAKKNKTGILIYVDLSRGKLKRVMSLRKNFTLDQFCDALGTNSDKWAGKTIDLERGGSEGQYVNVSN